MFPVLCKQRYYLISCQIRKAFKYSQLLTMQTKPLHFPFMIWFLFSLNKALNSTWSFILAFLGSVTAISVSVVILPILCSIPQLFSFNAASTFPVEGAGEERAESAGRGEMLSILLVLPLSSSSSSSLDKTTKQKILNSQPLHFSVTEISFQAIALK